MGIRRTTPPVPEIPLTSTADVAFLLLVFFLVAASNSHERGAPFDLPSTEKTQQKQSEQGNLEIELKPSAIVFAGSELPANVDLRTVLVNKLAGVTDPAKRVVLISADESVSYQRWADALVAIESAGGIPAPQIIEEDEQ